jgi:arginine decarboxylase-like protein
MVQRGVACMHTVVFNHLSHKTKKNFSKKRKIKKSNKTMHEIQNSTKFDTPKNSQRHFFQRQKTKIENNCQWAVGTLSLLVSQHLARNLCGFKLIEMVDKQNQNLGHVIEQIKTPPSRDFHSSRMISVLCLAFCYFVFIRNPRLELKNGDGKSGCYLVLGST